MARPKKQRDVVQESEVLNTQVRVDGVGEDPVIKALVSDEFATMPDTQAAQIGFQLQDLILKQNSVLEQIARGNVAAQEAQQKILERMDEYDRTAKAWEEDRMKFAMQMEALADKVRAVGSDRESIQATGMKIAENAMKEARIKAANERIQVAQKLASEPKETVVSPGVLYITTTSEGQMKPLLIPETIIIKDQRYVLQPGVPTQVPHSVAQIFYQRQRSKAATQQMQDALKGSSRKDTDAFRAWAEINKREGESYSPPPTVE